MKSKKSFLNFIVNIISLPLNAILGVILTQLTILHYGSDVNGVNATITQIIAVILVLEAGIGVATNSSLYKPYVEKNTIVVNNILTATQRIFRIIGLLFSIIAFIVACFLPSLLKSELEPSLILILFILAVVPSAIYLFYSVKYKVMFDISQNEYMISIINLITSALGQIFAIVSILLNQDIIVVRFWIMFFLIIRSILIWREYKKRFTQYKFNSSQPDYTALKSTAAVITIKITSMLYGTAPIIYISVFLNTMIASVYFVYNMIFSLIKSVVYAFVNAPFHAFGQLLAEENRRKEAQEMFITYEFLTIIVLSSLLSTSVPLTLPFIGIYTSGVKDIDYSDQLLVLLFFLIAFFEIIHIPSGILMQVTSKFEENKKMQIITSVVLLISIVCLSNLFELYGVLLANLICNILLCYLEIKFAHKNILKFGLNKFLGIIAVNLLMSILIIFMYSYYEISVTSYYNFILYLCLMFVVNTLIIVLVNFLVFKSYSVIAFNIVKNIFLRIVKQRRGN